MCTLASTSTHHQPNTNPTSALIHGCPQESSQPAERQLCTGVDRYGPPREHLQSPNSGSIPLAASRCSCTSEAPSASTSGLSVRFDGAEVARVTCLFFLRRCAVGALLRSI